MRGPGKLNSMTFHLAHASPTTTEALARIGALYGVEEEIRGKPAELRCSVRRARARPLPDDLRHRMEKALRSLSNKSETTAAIRYSLSHWKALTRYLDDGLLEIGRVEMWRGSLGLA
jgi:transposase